MTTNARSHGRSPRWARELHALGVGVAITPQAGQDSSEPSTTWSPGRSGSAEFSFTYGYDRLSRLTAVTGPDGARTYTSDPVGNRTAKVLGSSTAYTYDRADRITAAGATALTVDAAGNLVARGADTFTYDAANRLTTATSARRSPGRWPLAAGPETRFKKR